MTDRRPSSIIQVNHGNDGVVRVGDDALKRMSVSHANVVEELAEAKRATETEHSISVRDALKLYRKAVIFSLIFSTAVVMEGYDLSLMGSFLGFGPFKDRYTCLVQI